jgi:hypothetical protein
MSPRLAWDPGNDIVVIGCPFGDVMIWLKMREWPHISKKFAVASPSATSSLLRRHVEDRSTPKQEDYLVQRRL